MSSTVLFFMGLLFIWLLYRHIFIRVRARQLREDLFTLRDDLFDYMYKTELPYSMPAYAELRNLMNGAILAAPYFTLPFLIIGAYSNRHRSLNGPLVQALRGVENEAVRLHLKNTHQKVTSTILRSVLLGGPQWLLFRPLYQIVKWTSSTENRKSAKGPIYRTTDELAELGRNSGETARLAFVGLKEYCAR